jgi:hypothetical protein
MEQKGKKSLNHYMRALHRDVGFFIIGLTIIYSISGIVLIYRDTNFLKHEAMVEKKLSPNMEAPELGSVLHIRDFKVSKSEGDILYFQNGNYNKATGVATYSTNELPSFLNKFNSLHKSASKSSIHLFTTIFGILLLFLAISSFWMFKANSKLFRRGMILASAGIVVSIILLIL